MNKLMLVAAVSFAVFSPAIPATEEHDHPAQKGAPAKDAGMQMRMMQDNMLKMHELMHKIMQARDPKEREQLMQEHRQMMQEHMKMMGGGKGGMMGPGMMGAPAGK